MAVIGYIRVSSNKQTLEHQRFEIEEYARKHELTVDDWVEEKISSRKALKNRKLGELLENLQKNDILISSQSLREKARTSFFRRIKKAETLKKC